MYNVHYSNLVISSNDLTTLIGSPSIVEGYFNCDFNKLRTLEGGPKEVGGYYSFEHNRVTSLIGAIKICNDNFYCNSNLLTSLEGCPRIIKGDLFCQNNPDLEYLWGIGRVQGNIRYDICNKINEWIISNMRKGIIFPHFTIEENIDWIKREQKYSSLLGAPEEIRKHFSNAILNYIDTRIC